MDLRRDIRLSFSKSGEADISWESPVDGTDNLAQALLLRVLIPRGSLTPLGHPTYGSKVHALIGERIDRTNLGLLRRLLRQTLKQDPRVKDVLQITARAVPELPGVVEVSATVMPHKGAAVTFEASLDLG